jgi:hypothetical protein
MVTVGTVKKSIYTPVGRGGCEETSSKSCRRGFPRSSLSLVVDRQLSVAIRMNLNFNSPRE